MRILTRRKALNGDVWSWKMWLEFKKSQKKIVKQIGLSSIIKKKSKRRKKCPQLKKGVSLQFKGFNE